MAPLATALTRRAVPNLRPIGASLIGRDELLARVWRTHGSLGRRLANLGYAYVIGTAFSTWDEDTPLEGLRAVARSMALANLLSTQLPTIPTLAWRNWRDIERQVEWLFASVDRSPTIAVDLGAKPPEQFSWRLEGLSIAAKLTPDADDCRLIAHGVSALARVARVADIWPGPITVASQRPSQVGLHGDLLLDDLSTVRGTGFTRDACLASNVDTFSRAVSAQLARR